MTEHLDRALHQLADDVVFPPTPSMMAGIERRLAAATEGGRPRHWVRPLALALVLSLLVVAAVAALAWVLPGLRIMPTASLPAVPTAQLGAGLSLGQPAASAPFRLEALGPPDAAYVAGDGSVVSLAYASRPGLSELADAGIGLLVQRMSGDLDQAMIEKLVEEVGASVTPVTVAGADGFWITGPPHLVRYLAPDGAERAEMTRLAGDTLVWQRGGVLYRIESAVGLAETRRLAESITDD